MGRAKSEDSRAGLRLSTSGGGVVSAGTEEDATTGFS